MGQQKKHQPITELDGSVWPCLGLYRLHHFACKACHLIGHDPVRLSPCRTMATTDVRGDAVNKGKLTAWRENASGVAEFLQAAQDSLGAIIELLQTADIAAHAA